MSSGAKPLVLMPAYDAQELRRRVAVCFTIGELCALAAKLQVPQTPAWSNNPQEAARDIVRHFDRSGALAFLVEALREAKPLVEWPEPLPALPLPPAPALSPAPAEAPAGATARSGATVAEAPIDRALDYADTTVDPPEAAPAPTRHSDRPTPVSVIPAAAILAASGEAGASAAPGGFAPAVMPKPGEAPAAPSSTPGLPPAPSSAPSSSSRASAEEPPLALRLSAPSSRPAASAWPGTARPDAATSSKGLDRRLLAAAGAGLLVVIVGTAFCAGRASSSTTASGSGSSTGGTTAGAGPANDEAPLAQSVLAALGTSLERVARACQIDPATLRGRSLFEVAYRRCGPPPLPTADPRPTVVVVPRADSAPDTDPPAPTTKRGAGNKPQRADPAPATPPVTGGASCLTRCNGSHRSCNSACGAEPKQSSQYDAYQSCLSGCLKSLSQCKMGCQ